MRPDVVLSYHLNPLTCGVAKFNIRLARELQVPCASLFHANGASHPLVSIKASELGRHWLAYLPTGAYTLLLHDRPDAVPLHIRVLYADEMGCPATLEGNPTRGAYRVLTFGMAHKRMLPHYADLKRTLDVAHPDYTVELSTAIHEGHPWEAGLAQSIADMRAIFGDQLRVLGFLGDDALAKELHDCDAVAVYFDPALRANHTTAWAAVEAGKTLYTNRYAQSPTTTHSPQWDQIVARVTED